jgi:hypothetical protein
MAAQALALHRAVPGTGTIDIVPCRARVVLFRTVLVPAHRARAKWPGILYAASSTVWRAVAEGRAACVGPRRVGVFLFFFLLFFLLLFFLFLFYFFSFLLFYL